MEVLSAKVFTEQSGDFMKIIRKGLEKTRSVTIPMELVQWAVNNDATIREAKPSLIQDVILETTLKTWKIVVTLYNKEFYIGFSRFLGGKKIWTESINLNQREFNRLVELQGGEQEDFGVPAKKKARQTVNLWRWDISNVKGVKVSSCEAAFLVEQNCRDQCDLMKGVLEKEEEDTQKYEVTVHKTETLMPEAKELATKAYNYILRLELAERVKKFCAGCSYGSFNQDAHSNGCLGDREPIVSRYAKACRARVTILRLMEACRVIGKCFGNENLVPYCVCSDVIVETDPEKLLMEEKPDFEFEYQEINDL